MAGRSSASTPSKAKALDPRLRGDDEQKRKRFGVIKGKDTGSPPSRDDGQKPGAIPAYAGMTGKGGSASTPSKAKALDPSLRGDDGQKPGAIPAFVGMTSKSGSASSPSKATALDPRLRGDDGQRRIRRPLLPFGHPLPQGERKMHQARITTRRSNTPAPSPAARDRASSLRGRSAVRRWRAPAAGPRTARAPHPNARTASPRRGPA